MAAIISPTIDLLLGVAFSILATIMFNYGFIYQKIGVKEIPEIKMTNIKSLWNMVKNKNWFKGVVIVMIGGPFYGIGQMFIGVAFVQPLQGLGLLILAYFSLQTLKEDLSKKEKIGVLFISISPILLIFAGISDIALISLNFENWISIFVFCSIFIVLVLIVILILRNNAQKKSLSLSISSGILFGIGAITGQVQNFGLEPFLRSFNIGDILWVPFIIGAISVIIGNAIAGIWMQQAFQIGKANTSKIISFQFVPNLIVPIIGGIIIFGQAIQNWLLFLLGVIIMGIGMLLLSSLQASLESGELINKIYEQKLMDENEPK